MELVVVAWEKISDLWDSEARGMEGLEMHGKMIEQSVRHWCLRRKGKNERQRVCFVEKREGEERVFILAEPGSGQHLEGKTCERL